jgi:phage I-like protein
MLRVAAANTIELTDVPSSIMLLPLGAMLLRDGRSFTVGDATAIVAATLARMGSAKMVVDYEHQSLNAPKNGQPAPAAGWIKTVELRDDGIYGEVEWTQQAAALLASKQYRYISPVFSYDENGNVTCIINAALTNNPAIDMRAAASALLDANADNHNQTESNNMNTLKERLLAASALPADATDDVLVQHVAAIAAAAAQPDPAKFVPLAVHDAVAKELAALQTAVTEDKARAAVASALTEGKITPAQKVWAEDYAKKDLVGFTAYVAGASKVAAATNLGGAPHIDVDATHGLTSDELAVCSSLGVAPEQFAKEKKEG